MKVKVTSDTLFKLSPKLSKELTETEKVFVKTGTEYEIDFYVDIGDNHLKIELANATIDASGNTSWYVYQPDVEIQTSSVKLEVVSDTLFKQEPILSSDLSDAQKVFVKRGTKFDLQSYVPAQGNHVKIAIANAFLGPENRNTWHVYNPDIKITGSTINMKVTSDTLFKLEPTLSSQLTDAQKIFIKNGTIFEVESHTPAESSHVRVALASAFLGPENRNTWYAYAPDIEIEGNEPDNKPQDSAPPKQSATPKDPGKAIRLPGFSGLYYLNNPIVTGGNFTWGEATHGGTRIPVNSDIVYGFIRIAKAMEEVRKLYGNRPITINSWYRDPKTNAAVGGARYSRHLNGDAVDFNVAGQHPYDVYARLNGWWGSKGGLASSTKFTHMDVRGYRARWSYGY